MVRQRQAPCNFCRNRGLVTVNTSSFGPPASYVTANPAVVPSELSAAMTPQEWSAFVAGAEAVESNALANTPLSLFYLVPLLGWGTMIATAGGFKEDLLKALEAFCAEWNQKAIGGGKVRFASRNITNQVFVVDIIIAPA